MGSFIGSIASFGIVQLIMTCQKDKTANLQISVGIGDHQGAQDHLATACRNQATLHAESFNTEEWRTCYLEVCHFQLHLTNQFDFGTSAFRYIVLEVCSVFSFHFQCFVVLCKLPIDLAQLYWAVDSH